MDLHPDIATIMEILGVCVLADRLERDVELVEYVECVQRLARRVEPDTILARRDIRAWFAKHREGFLATLDSEDAMRALLARVEDPGPRDDLLAAIFSISVCDYNLADEESAFLALAVEVWKPDAPLTPEAVEAIA